MSITFSVNNNEEYCEKNKLFKIERQFHLGKSYTLHHYPFELNVACSSCAQICDLLNIPTQDHGEIDVEELIALILHAMPENCIVAPTTIEGEQGAVMIESGYDISRNTRYLQTLLDIAQEAIRRGENLSVWG